MRKIRKCPFCENGLKPNTSHIYHCISNSNTSDKNDIKFEYIKYNFPDFIDNVNIDYIENNLSLTDIKKKYGIDFKSTLFILDYFGIKKRSLSESAKTISVKKQKETLMSKYGVDWSSKLEHVKELKRKNCINKYGVDNIWKSDWFKENRENFHIEKYGMSVSEQKKMHWMSLSEEDKRNHMLKSALSSSFESSIEGKIKLLLDLINIQYTSQFTINNGKGSLYFYDICIGDIIIEINGDFWHANPNKYKKDDILRFPGKEVLCESLWDKDKIKKEIANKKGYKVVYIWESFIRNSTNDEIIYALEDIIKNKNLIDKNLK